MSDDLSALGHGLVAVAKELTDVGQFDLTKTSPKEILDQIESWKKRSGEKFDKRMNGALATVHAGQAAILNMMQKSVEDNVAGLAEAITDAIIIGQITGFVTNLAGVVGNKCIDAASGINIAIPADLLNATPKIINGQAVAVVGGKSINLGGAIAAGAEGALDPLIGAGHLAAQGSNFYNKSKNSGSGNGGKQGGENKGKSEGGKAPSTPEYTYEHGTYEGADYHKKGQTTNWGDKTKSPEPQNGQTCLDNSYGVKDYPHRVAIEDGKVVVIRKTADGNYHGYVCDAWKDVPSELQAALRKEKLVHPKSGEVLKK